jgi:ankyrin repeat protein
MVSYLIKTFPESINMKTPSGLTPLHLAFYVRRLPLAKMLIEAGADVNARDHNGSNLMHILLSSEMFPSQGSSDNVIYDHEAMSEFMKLLGEEKCHQLLLERNKSNPQNGGARTPFHSWILNERGTHSDCSDHCCGMETFELLLKYSKGDALTMIDGSGDTPVHTVVLNPNINFLRQMLVVNPESLFRENAVGRTPMELCRDLFLSSKVADPPNNVTEYNHWNIPEHMKSLKDRNPKSFISEEQPNDRDAIWNICLNHNLNHEARRRLVSLSEANEVARRLASSAESKTHRKTHRTSTDDINEELKRKDEVREWLPSCGAGAMGVNIQCSQNESSN